MSSIDLALMGIKNLLRRKARTILTVLGVVIGTASIVVMVSIGLGMDIEFQKQLEEFGSLTMVNVSANYYGDTGQRNSSDDNKVLLDDEAIAKIEALDNVEYAVGFKRFDTKLYSGKYESYTSIKAVDFDKLSKMGIELSSGVMPTKEGKNEVLVGFYVNTSFYNPKSRDPWMNPPVLDVYTDKIEMIPNSNYYETKRPRGYTLKPTGVTTETDWAYASDVFMDYDTFVKLKKEFEIKNKQPNDGKNPNVSKPSKKVKDNKYDELKVNVAEIDEVKVVQDAIVKMGFQAFSMTEALEQNKKTSGMIQAVLGGIGGVSLFVAAIGITNTMVMSIYERTKEIGVMKVIGAQIRDIKRLFLFEAAMIGLIGGIMGIGLSYGTSQLINKVIANMSTGAEYGGLTLSSYIPIWLALSGMGFSTLVGLVAGYYPAVRATKLSALEAIRTE